MTHNLILAGDALLFCNQSLNSQVLEGSVTDSDYNFIAHAIVKNTTLHNKTTCDFSAYFVLRRQGWTAIQISHPEYESQEFPISGSNTSDTIFPIIQDHFNNIFYDLSNKRGTYSLTAIIQANDVNVVARHLTLSDVPSASNIKIYNDWVYFVNEENGNRGLYRNKIPIEYVR